MNDDLNTLHAQLFPEEYDYMYDSSLDAKERAQGINPMSQDYIDRVNARYATIGIAPYTVTDDAPGNLSTNAWNEEHIASDLRTAALSRRSILSINAEQSTLINR